MTKHKRKRPVRVVAIVSKWWPEGGVTRFGYAWVWDVRQKERVVYGQRRKKGK